MLQVQLVSRILRNSFVIGDHWDPSKGSSIPHFERSPDELRGLFPPFDHTQQQKNLTGVCEIKAPLCVYAVSYTSPRVPPHFNVDSYLQACRAGSGFYFAIRRDGGLLEIQH